MMSPYHSCDDVCVSGKSTETDVRTPSVVATLGPASPPPSPVARLALPHRPPGQGVDAWRIVARYRSGTVAGSHGLPCFPRRHGMRLSCYLKFKELEGKHRAGPQGQFI